MKTFLRSLILLILLFTSLKLMAEEPYSITAELQPAALQGSGKLTFLGLHIYDAALYRSARAPSTDFALEIRYQKSLSGATLSSRTMAEMKKLGIPEERINVWGNELAGFMPDIEAGQNLTAVYSAKQGTIFLFEGKRIALIRGDDFAKAFFGIWLDPKTSVPKLRGSLLGQGCPPPLISGGC
jgi:hypothetical protein